MGASVFLFVTIVGDTYAVAWLANLRCLGSDLGAVTDMTRIEFFSMAPAPMRRAAGVTGHVFEAAFGCPSAGAN
jgi:hypothetical protein